MERADILSALSAKREKFNLTMRLLMMGAFLFYPLLARNRLPVRERTSDI